MAPNADRTQRATALEGAMFNILTTNEVALSIQTDGRVKFVVGEDEWTLWATFVFHRSSYFRSAISKLFFNGIVVLEPPPGSEKLAVDAALQFLYGSNYLIPFGVNTTLFHAKVFLLLDRLDIPHGKDFALGRFAKLLALEYRQRLFLDAVPVIYTWDEGNERVLELKNTIIQICWECSSFLVLDKDFPALCREVPAFGEAVVAKFGETIQAYRSMLPPLQKQS